MYSYCIYASVFFTSVFPSPVFRSKPPTPPNAAQAEAESARLHEAQQRLRQHKTPRAVSRVPDAEHVAGAENGAALVCSSAFAPEPASGSAPAPDATLVEARPVALSAGAREYLSSLAGLACNVPFVLLTISYGINTGCYYAISTLISPIVEAFFAVSSARHQSPPFHMHRLRFCI